ncbi:regulatory protein RecX [Reinekea marinisedimentorum]|uniref:Regulatory protein RecX n=1 Tax=Reinekea marinisedimentorum TaxID=230495 RepID=A0A4R3I528_9GAMM|nr:regulatory protein RecX [Reinekea marinisedimentorum]TCS40741.1 regulatory protein [Reinekea marinisedimentorum]
MSIWNAALGLLARREYSQHELKSKLSGKFPDSGEEIEQVLARLIDQGLQSDERYVDMWLNSQIEKGRGPVRITYDARQKGIAHLMESAMQAKNIDWFELAAACLQRKFSAVADQKEKARAYRFLSYRGFNPDMIRYAVEQLSTSDSSSFH